MSGLCLKLISAKCLKAHVWVSRFKYRIKFALTRFELGVHLVPHTLGDTSTNFGTLTSCSEVTSVIVVVVLKQLLHDNVRLWSCEHGGPSVGLRLLTPTVLVEVSVQPDPCQAAPRQIQS
jgi:hypothetical protein